MPSKGTRRGRGLHDRARAENRRSLEAVPTFIHVGSLRLLNTLSSYCHCWRCRPRSCLEAECGEQRKPADQKGVKRLLGCVSPSIQDQALEVSRKLALQAQYIAIFIASHRTVPPVISSSRQDSKDASCTAFIHACRSHAPGNMSAVSSGSGRSIASIGGPRCDPGACRSL
jgi:hypothetical protein